MNLIPGSYEAMLTHRLQEALQGLVFVRLHAEDRAFYFLGPVSYLSHQAEMPMQITWKLSHPLPADLFMAYRAAAA